MALINRRKWLALLGAGLLAGCGGVTAYKDTGGPNLQVALGAKDSSFWTKRDVYIDVWTGPKGPEMQYLGTRKVGAGGTSMGLPVGRPLHLVLAFEERGGLGSYSSTQSVEIPMAAIPRGAVWRMDLAYTRVGFSHEMRRIR